jgi:hypothetical protein
LRSKVILKSTLSKIIKITDAERTGSKEEQEVVESGQ